MNRYKITGGSNLQGTIEVQGAKNAALPILAATIINGGKSTVHNCPMLSDIEATLEMLKYLGCSVTRIGKDVIVDSSYINCKDIPAELMNKTRSSTIFAGALLARCRKFFIAEGGGCPIGSRPINIHLEAFEKMGVEIVKDDRGVTGKANEIKPCRLILPFPSVGATENIMLAASLTIGMTVIYNAAREPEIVNLAMYLESIGVRVNGAGTETVTIFGTDAPHGGEITVISDRIAAATYAAAVSCAGGNITVNGISPSALSPVIAVLRKMGVSIRCFTDNFTIFKDTRTQNIPYIETAPYPGFPTDCQSLIVALMATSKGIGIMREKIFENRFALCDKLNIMGADIEVKGRTAVINGVYKLCGNEVDATDLRCGAALAVASLGAEGTTIISNTHYIDRGYENLCLDFKNLGAEIERIE